MNTVNTMRAPYASSGVADAIMDIFRRLNPPKINAKFIIENKIASQSNAFTATDFVKWLGITDTELNVNPDIANKLRLVGEEREEFIRELVKTAYKDLFEKVNILEARREDITNYFVTSNNMGTSAAKYATGLFVHLCHKYKIPVADDIKKKTHSGGRPIRQSEGKKKRKKEKKKKSSEKNKDYEEENILPEHTNISLPLGENRMAKIIFPIDITNKEIGIIEKLMSVFKKETE